ncbi:hypothetical protein MWMV8_MWMV8_02539 [Acinetobacter calcoaceticus]|jgi:hypothetical protein|nr:hypothetical protein MWMV8_MWMV8_02539 [Acinetobacter calcoaceticus]
MFLFLLLDYQFIRFKHVLKLQSDPKVELVLEPTHSKSWIYPLLVGVISECILSISLFLYLFQEKSPLF